MRKGEAVCDGQHSREGFRDAGEVVAAVRGDKVLLDFRLPPQARAERVPVHSSGSRWRRRRRGGGGIHQNARVGTCFGEGTVQTQEGGCVCLWKTAGTGVRWVKPFGVAFVQSKFEKFNSN